MPFTKSQLTQLKVAAAGLPTRSPSEPIEGFISRVLGIPPLQLAVALDSDTLAESVAELTRQREDSLEIRLQIPSYVVFSDFKDNFFICGLSDFLTNRDVDSSIVARLEHHALIRTALQSIRKPHDFEVLAAAIMEGMWNFGEATRGSGDQGMDAIGLQELASIDISLNSGDVSTRITFPGEQVFVLASSKVTTITKKGKPTLIQPPHIRELIGGWVLQRSEQSAWKKFDVRMLSPLQMVLVTTYRLSVASKALCRDIGIQVWGLPQLIYLICKSAPAGVFDATHNFNNVEFGKWWRRKRSTRLQPES